MKIAAIRVVLAFSILASSIEASAGGVIVSVGRVKYDTNGFSSVPKIGRIHETKENAHYAADVLYHQGRVAFIPLSHNNQSKYDGIIIWNNQFFRLASSGEKDNITWTIQRVHELDTVSFLEDVLTMTRFRKTPFNEQSYYSWQHLTGLHAYASGDLGLTLQQTLSGPNLEVPRQLPNDNLPKFMSQLTNKELTGTELITLEDWPKVLTTAGAIVAGSIVGACAIVLSEALLFYH